LLADAADLRRLHSAPGAHEAANRGEIATALLAGRLGDTVAITDDDLGKRLCRTRGVPRLSTAQLVPRWSSLRPSTRDRFRCLRRGHAGGCGAEAVR
jgi:hypothetical protein